MKQNECCCMGFGHCPWGDRDFFSIRWGQEKVKFIGFEINLIITPPSKLAAIFVGTEVERCGF